jgi:hypothetical protein
VSAGGAAGFQNGGSSPSSKQLTLEQKAIDRKIRLQISHELGHGREQITTVYLGP